MRNSWYPRHKAEYMTGPTYQGLKPQKIAAERDFTFGMEPKEDPSVKEKAPESARLVEVKTKLLPVCLFWQSFVTQRRLTRDQAATGYRDLRDVITPKYGILQSSYKCP